MEQYYATEDVRKEEEEKTRLKEFMKTYDFSEHEIVDVRPSKYGLSIRYKIPARVFKKDSKYPELYVIDTFVADFYLDLNYLDSSSFPKESGTRMNILSYHFSKHSGEMYIRFQSNEQEEKIRKKIMSFLENQYKLNLEAAKNWKQICIKDN